MMASTNAGILNYMLSFVGIDPIRALYVSAILNHLNWEFAENNIG